MENELKGEEDDKKKMKPNTSIHTCVRFENRPTTTSMRTCSLRLSVWADAKRKMAPNKYHWISSQEFELVLKMQRTSALPLQISTASSNAQLIASPIFSLISSMNREKDNKDDIVGFLSRKIHGAQEGADRRKPLTWISRWEIHIRDRRIWNGMTRIGASHTKN